MNDVAWITMNNSGEVEIHTTEPMPIEAVFRAICGIRKLANENVLKSQEDGECSS